jgi:hypothetical protein
MRLTTALLAFAALCAPVAAGAQTIADTDTKAWWAITKTLSSDAYEGRDTGSAGYARAADYVAKRFAAAGLQPAGDNGTFLQPVPMREVRVDSDGTSFVLTREGGPPVTFGFLREVSVGADAGLPAALEGGVAFRGLCSAGEVGADVAGKVVVCFASRGKGAPSAGARVAAVTKAGGVGVITVDDMRPATEPLRWPQAYSRSVEIAEGPAKAPSRGPTTMRMSADAFGRLVAGTGQDAGAILVAGMADKPLPSFDIPGRFKATFKISRREYASPNVLGLLPGTDPRLKPQVLVLSAHLDGYGYGEPVDGDGLYNGAFDDAAYVATLVRLAEQRKGKGFRRSVLFAAWAAEEKGLHGSNWFVRHPTVPKEDLAAAINLDQLRPLFPLKILTQLAIDTSTLGADARAVGEEMGIRLRPDPEPERNLLRRSDHWPFLQIGVPATGFIFGYEPGTQAEARYKEWYRVRYHRPQDDISQPIDFVAARDFNSFFYKLADRVANAEARPAMLKPIQP